MIPSFDSVSGDLPPGIYDVTWHDLVGHFGYTPHRLVLLAGLKEAFDILRQAGCERAYIDGSFVTSKVQPNDFDACWEMAGVDFDLLHRLDPALLDWSNRRAAQKVRFRGELFLAESAADPWGTTYLEFFQHNRDTGEPKGIIAIDLRGLP